MRLVADLLIWLVALIVRGTRWVLENVFRLFALLVLGNVKSVKSPVRYFGPFGCLRERCNLGDFFGMFTVKSHVTVD